MGSGLDWVMKVLKRCRVCRKRMWVLMKDFRVRVCRKSTVAIRADEFDSSEEEVGKEEDTDQEENGKIECWQACGGCCT